jgi:DNA-binding Xre family transcriptional regulator
MPRFVEPLLELAPHLIVQILVGLDANEPADRFSLQPSLAHRRFPRGRRVRKGARHSAGVENGLRSDAPALEPTSSTMSPAKRKARRQKGSKRKPSLKLRRLVARNVKRLRGAISQKELGQRCGLNEKYISNIEQATQNITLANLETLAKGLGCLPHELLAPDED